MQFHTQKAIMQQKSCKYLQMQNTKLYISGHCLIVRNKRESKHLPVGIYLFNDKHLYSDYNSATGNQGALYVMTQDCFHDLFFMGKIQLSYDSMSNELLFLIVYSLIKYLLLCAKTGGDKFQATVRISLYLYCEDIRE